MESFLGIILFVTLAALVLVCLHLMKAKNCLNIYKATLAASRSQISTSKKEVESARELIARLDDKTRAQSEDLDKVARFMDWVYGCGILFVPKETPDTLDQQICQLISGIEGVDVTISKATKSEAHLITLINDAYNEALKSHEGYGAVTDKPATMLVYLRNRACQVQTEQKRWEGLLQKLNNLAKHIKEEFSRLDRMPPTTDVESQVTTMRMQIERLRKHEVKNLECLKPVLKALVEHGALEESDLVPNAEETSTEQVHIGRELAVNGVCTLGLQANKATAKLTMIRSILEREGHVGDLSKHGSVPGGQRAASPGDERANGHAG